MVTADTPSTCATSRATPEKSSSGVAPPATRVATRRSAACSASSAASTSGSDEVTTLLCSIVAPYRVVVADDDVLLREGLASLLAGAGYDVIGQAGDGAALEAMVRDQAPDLAVVDIRMPPTNTWEGLDAARAIR